MTLFVKWNEMESASYYVDKDRYSRAHENKYEFTLDSYCGTYHFNKKTQKVILDTGVELRDVSVKDWYIETA